MNLRKSLQYYLALNSYVERIQSAGLPGEYTSLEYISNASSTRIDTSIVPDVDDMVFEVKVKPTGGSWYVLQARNGPGGVIYGLSGSGSGQTFIFGWNGISLNIPDLARDATHTYLVRGTAKNGNMSIYVRDLTTNIEYNNSASYTTFVALDETKFVSVFGNNQGDYIQPGNSLYYAKIWKGGKLVLDYIPVQDSTGVAGFYDSITSTFNAATYGSLVGGPSTTDFKDAIHNGLKEITAYGKAIQPAKDYLDTVTANGGTELVPTDYIDSATAKGGTSLRKVPKEYEELEYLESSGTQYIDTGIKVKENTLITSKFMFTSSTAASRRLFGKIAGPSTAAMNYRETGTFYWFGSMSITASSDSIHTIDFNADGKIYRDGTQIGTKGTAASLNDTTMYLFAEISDNNTINYGQVKVYNFMIKEGSTIVQNLIPARRKADGELGMFDTVSGAFLTNNGTGTLIAGPIVSIPDDYTRLAYLTGDGAAYIDLGISLTQDDEFELDFIMPSSSISMQNIFGYRNSASSNAMTAMIASTSNSFVTDFNNSDYSPYRLLTNISAATAYKVITNKNSRVLYQGDTLIDSNTTACGDTITTGNVLVFNIGGSPAYTNKFTGSISRVIVKNRINLIPAKRNSDGVLGMYDTINNQFYTNTAETGAFIAGPEIGGDPNNPYDIYCNNGKLIKTANEANYIASNVTIGYWIRNSDGQPETSAANFYTNMMPIKPNTSYVCFGRNKLDNTLSQYNRIAWYDSTGTWISNCTYTVNTVTVAISPVNAAYARFHCNATTNNITQEIIDSYNWTFCEGTEEVAYTPYITTSTQEILQDASGNMAVVQNLLQLDSTYQDTQEILTGIVTGKIGMLIVDGINEGRKIGTAWNATYKRGSFAVAGMLSTTYSVVDAICGHFKYATDVYGSPTTPGFCTNNGTIFFSFASMDNITSAAEANAWFEAQYRAGTPVIVLYPLATATSTIVDSQTLRKEPVYVIQGGLDNLAVDIVSSAKTVPTPNYPLDIRCNNGDLNYSKNMFDSSLFDTYAGGLTYRSFDIPNGTYTMSTPDFPMEQAVTNVFVFPGQVTTGASSANNGVYQGMPRTITVTDGKYTVCYRSTSGTGNDNDPKDFHWQLEIGSSATNYTPYLSSTGIAAMGIQETLQDSADTINIATCEDLFAIGTYADTQEILTGIITRKVGIKVLNGTENWQNISGYYNISKTALDTNSTVLPAASVDIICTHYETISGVPDRTSVNVGGSYVNFRDDNISTLSEWQQYLADQYAKGTPVIIIYPLATATTESVSGQTLVTPPVSIKQASMSGLTVDTTQSTVTVPTPTRPLDIYCNNGKLGFAGIGDNYTQLEYLESTGTEYIDTGIAVPTNYKWELVLNSRGSNTAPYWGYANNNTYSSATSFYSLGANGTSQISGIVLSVGVFNGSAESDQASFYNAVTIPDAGNMGGDAIHTIRCEGDFVFTTDGTPMTQKTAKTFTAFTPTGTAYLFARHTPTMNASMISKSSARIYSYKVWNENGVLVQELIPVKSSDSTLGMYDTVSGTFFTNAGTGDFVAGPVVPGSRGNPETITIYSKNLFNKNGNLKIGTYRVDNGTWVDNAQFKTLDYIPGKPGVSYTLSAQSTSETGGNAFSVQAWDSTHTNWLGTIASTTAQNVQYASGISPAGTAYLSVSFAPTYRDINTVQLEEDYRPTVYEEYGSQTLSVKDLLSVSGYADSQELINGIVTKKVDIKILDGTENWNVGTGTGSVSAYLSGATSSWGVDNTVRGMCTHFNCRLVGEIVNAGDYRFANDLNIYNLPAALNISTKEEFKAWLAAQYAAGTPVTIVYLLATATTETVDAQDCRLTAGNSKLERKSDYIEAANTTVDYLKLK